MSKEPLLVPEKTKLWHMGYKEMREQCDSSLTLEEAKAMSFASISEWTGEHKRGSITPVKQQTFDKLEEDKYTAAMLEVESSTSVEELKQIWGKYPELQKRPGFILGVNLRKKQLEECPELDLK